MDKRWEEKGTENFGLECEYEYELDRMDAWMVNGVFDGFFFWGGVVWQKKWRT